MMVKQSLKTNIHIFVIVQFRNFMLLKFLSWTDS